MEIRCPRCDTHKDESQFNLNKNKKTGRQAYCKECQRSFDKSFYNKSESRRAGIHERNLSRYLENKQFVLDYLKKNPCVDCGESDPVVLDFDHRRDKKYHVSCMVRSCSIKTIESEIEKCDIRCANCHRRKHASHRGLKGY